MSHLGHWCQAKTCTWCHSFQTNLDPHDVRTIVANHKLAFLRERFFPEMIDHIVRSSLSWLSFCSAFARQEVELHCFRLSTRKSEMMKYAWENFLRTFKLHSMVGYRNACRKVSSTKIYPAHGLPVSLSKCNFFHS